ncbi:hypothetical protein GOV05_03155, partial [Candidatus Woesearchaeota archaeon]|nr:hypothetical protein [Candidatus Woesearchaeota archaeon]
MLALLFVLVVLSLAVPVKNPTGYAVGSDDLVFPRCEYDKANIDKLSSTKFGGCQKHYDYFDAYRDDIDLLYLYAVAYQESSCRDAQQLRSSGSKVWAGGILQVDNPCLCSASKIEGYESCYANYGGRWQCSDVGDQVRQGIELIKKSYDYLENKKIKSPEDLFLLASLEHNRGRTTVANTISYMNKYDVVTSMIKSCEEIYNKDGNGCPLCKYDSSGNDKCRTVGLGAGYPYKIFQYYEEACSLVGGSLNFDVGEYEELLKGTISQRTGFFVRRPVVRQKVGTYELNPSFLLKEFFDFETFNRIRDELSVLSENCSESKNKKGCVEAFLGDASKNTEKLKIGPQEEDEAELFGIAEKIFLCSNDN